MRLPTLLVVPAAGFLVALAAAVALLVALPGPGGGEVPGPGDGQDAEEVIVAAVVSSGAHDADLVVLRAIEGEALVPVPVSAAEGARIRNGDASPGNRSLLEEAVAALGGTIEAAVLDARASELTAHVIVDDEGRRVELPASAAEAIAAAVETGRPIFTTRRAIEASALTGEDLDRIHGGELPPPGGPSSVSM